LDRECARYWELDRRLLVIPLGAAPSAPPRETFRPGGPDGSGSLVVAREHSAHVDGDPVAIEAAPDGSVLVLLERAAEPASPLQRYVAGRPEGSPVALGDHALELHVAGHDMALVPAAEPRRDGALGTLFVADRGGNQAFAFALAAGDDGLRAELVRSYYPL